MARCGLRGGRQLASGRSALHTCQSGPSGCRRIFALRKPKTNIQILQQNVLLKQKHLVGFLREHGQEVFGEVRAAYADTLSRVLSSHFRAYLAALERLQVSSRRHLPTCAGACSLCAGSSLRSRASQTVLSRRMHARLQQDVAGPADVVGEAPASGVGGVVANLLARAGGGTQAARHDAFALGDRGAILHHLDQAALIPHVVEAEGRKAPVEVRGAAPTIPFLDFVGIHHLKGVVGRCAGRLPQRQQTAHGHRDQRVPVLLQLLPGGCDIPRAVCGHAGRSGVIAGRRAAGARHADTQRHAGLQSLELPVGCSALLCPASPLSEAIFPQETFDLVGLLLMIRVNYHHQLLMAKRRIPCLDDYLDRINLLLWPRFKVSAMRHLLLATSAACTPEHKAARACRPPCKSASTALLC